MTIISHKHKFIFIKTRKTAGTSIQVMLEEFCGEEDIVTPIGKPSTEAGIKYNERVRNNKGYVTHMSAKDVRKNIGKKIWNSYFKFAFERNPWDKLVSKYCFRKVEQDFNEWIYTLKKSPWTQPMNFELYSIRGKVAVDFLGKFENLYEDLNKILNKLNLPLKNLPYEKKSRGKEKRDYRIFYDERAKDYVANLYKKEIKLFSYAFD